MTLAHELLASTKPLVIIESPYAGDVLRNLAYARECLLDSLLRGEAPIASHLLHTQVLDDINPEERERGITAGLAWFYALTKTEGKVVAYVDLGWSSGMHQAIELARRLGIPTKFRTLANANHTPPGRAAAVAKKGQ